MPRNRNLSTMSERHATARREYAERRAQAPRVPFPRWMAVVLVLALCGGFAGVVSQARAATPTYACGAEDGAAWQWSRCGNRTRGITTVGGRRLTVGPLRFCRLDRDGRIAWGTDTFALPGDRHARTRC
jgi:hypothetical protein